MIICLLKDLVDVVRERCSAYLPDGIRFGGRQLVFILRIVAYFAQTVPNFFEMDYRANQLEILIVLVLFRVESSLDLKGHGHRKLVFRIVPDISIFELLQEVRVSFERVRHSWFA